MKKLIFVLPIVALAACEAAFPRTTQGFEEGGIVGAVQGFTEGAVEVSCTLADNTLISFSVDVVAANMELTEEKEVIRMIRQTACAARNGKPTAVE